MSDKFGYIHAKVMIGGKDVAGGGFGALDEIRTHLVDHGVSRCEVAFVLANPDWSLVKTATGQTIEVHLGYKKEPELVFSGEVTGVRCRGRRKDAAILVLEASDRLHRLGRGIKQRVLLKVTETDVFKKLLAEAGLAAGKVDDPGITYESIAQYNQSNLDFLMDRARRLGLCLWAEGSMVHFRARGVNTTSVELNLSDTLEKVNIRSTVAYLAPTVQIRGWDPKTKKETVGSAAGGKETLIEASGEAGTKVAKSFVASQVVVGDALPRSTKEADELAKRQLFRRSLGFSLGTATLVGDPTIKPGQRVKLSGLPPRECGSYHVGLVTHRFNFREGFYTDLRLMRNHHSKP